MGKTSFRRCLFGSFLANPPLLDDLCYLSFHFSKENQNELTIALRYLLKLAYS